LNILLPLTLKDLDSMANHENSSSSLYNKHTDIAKQS